MRPGLDQPVGGRDGGQVGRRDNDPAGAVDQAQGRIYQRRFAALIAAATPSNSPAQNSIMASLQN